MQCGFMHSAVHLNTMPQTSYILQMYIPVYLQCNMDIHIIVKVSCFNTKHKMVHFAALMSTCTLICNYICRHFHTALQNYAIMFMIKTWPRCDIIKYSSGPHRGHSSRFRNDSNQIKQTSSPTLKPLRHVPVTPHAKSSINNVLFFFCLNWGNCD